MAQHGYIEHVDDDFTDAMSASPDGEYVSTDDNEPVAVGTQLAFGTDFHTFEGFLDFDTTAIAGPVDTATLTLGGDSGPPADPTADLLVLVYDWGGSPLTSGDWRTPAQLAALSEAGRIPAASIPNTGETVDIDIDPSAVNTGGRTRFVLATEDMLAPATAPTGEQRSFMEGLTSGANPPALAVEEGEEPEPEFEQPTVSVRDIDDGPWTSSGLDAGRLDDAQVVSITRTKNQPKEAVIEFPKHSYTRQDVHVFSGPAGSAYHELKVVRLDVNGDPQVRFLGPAVEADAESGENKVTLDCRGIEWPFYQRYLDAPRDNLLDNASFEAGTDTDWDSTGGLSVDDVNDDDAVHGDFSLILDTATNLGDEYKSQTFSVTGTGVGTHLSIAAYFKIPDTLTGHALDRRGLYVESRDGGDFKRNNFYPIDEATHLLGTGWLRAKVPGGLFVPPNVTRTIEVRLYAAPGGIRWDRVQVVAMQSISTATITGDTETPVDISEIVGLIHTFVQDPSVGKSNLGIGLDCPSIGQTQVKHIQWADHISWRDQMAEWLERDDLFDYSIRDSTRELVVHVPYQGTDRRASMTLQYFSDPAEPRNVRSYEFTEDGGGSITDSTVLLTDTGDGPDREEGHFADASLVGNLTLQSVEAAPTKADPNALLPIARDRVNRKRRPAALVTLTINGAQLHDGVPYDEKIGIGDVINVLIDDGWVQLDGYGRVEKLVEYPRNRQLDVTIALTIPPED